MKKTLSLLITLSILTMPLAAQDIGDKLSALLSANAELYLNPLPTAVGVAMNSATFQRARPHKILGFDATFSLGVVYTPSDNQTYEFAIDDITLPVPLPNGTSYDVTFANDQLYPGSRTAQNIFGEKDSTVFAANSSYAFDQIVAELTTTYNIDSTIIANAAATIQAAADGIPNLVAPPGLGAGGFIIAVPQLSIGLPMGLEVSFRGGIDLDVPGFGTISYGGFGGKIYLNKFIPTVPLLFPAISVGFYTTNLDIDTPEASLSSTNSIINLQVSKSLPIITVFGGIGVENSSLKVSYTYTPPPELGGNPIPFDFSADGDNKLRTTVGARLKFLLVTFHGAYVKNGDYSGFYGGIGLTFR